VPELLGGREISTIPQNQYHDSVVHMPQSWQFNSTVLTLIITDNKRHLDSSGIYFFHFNDLISLLVDKRAGRKEDS